MRPRNCASPDAHGVRAPEPFLEVAADGESVGIAAEPRDGEEGGELQRAEGKGRHMVICCRTNRKRKTPERVRSAPQSRAQRVSSASPAERYTLAPAPSITTAK